MMILTPGTERPRRHRRVPHWRNVPLWGVALLMCGVAGAAMPVAAMAEPRIDPHARPDTPPRDSPRRIPGEGVQEEPPEAEDDDEERKAAPQPDIGGCPYRGRRLELIV